MSLLINSLTEDEDLRQDLWVAHLSGAPISQLFNTAVDARIFNIYTKIEQPQIIQQLFSSPLPDQFLNNFSDIQRSIMCLLTIGYNIGEVCVHLGMNEVSIRRIIREISQNKAWDNLWPSNVISMNARNSD